MSPRAARAAALAGAMLPAALTGCGQKGPLYLPDKGGTIVTSAPAAPAPAAPSPPATPKKDTTGSETPPPQ